MVTDQRLWISLGTAVASLAVLIWMIAAGPGFLGYGASLLWTGPRKPPIYDLRVHPGDAVVRRHADQLVSAIPAGLKSPDVKLHARYREFFEVGRNLHAANRPSVSPAAISSSSPRCPRTSNTTSPPAPSTSKHFNISVTDLPAVKQINVTYHFPSWTGIPPETEERGGRPSRRPRH